MPPPQPIAEERRRMRLFVYDRHEQARESLQALFEDEGFDVVGTTADADCAVAQILALRPDVCVLDIGIPTASGLAVCRRVTDLTPPIPCVMLAPWDIPELARAARAAGAKSFVLKNVFTNELLTAVTAAAALAPRERGASGDLVL